MKLKKKQFKKSVKEKNSSQLGFTLLTRHLRHEIGIEKLFCLKMTQKKGSNLNK